MLERIICWLSGHRFGFWYTDDVTGLMCWCDGDDCQRCGARRR